MSQNKAYTPTDEDVREAWRAFAGANRLLGSFDRWLAAHDAQVARNARHAEKKRIAMEVRFWANVNTSLGNRKQAERLETVSRDIERIPEEPLDA